jgi:hypothetical protein
MQGTLDNVLDIPHPVHTKKLVTYQTHMLSHLPRRKENRKTHEGHINPYLAVVKRVSPPAHHIQNVVSLVHLTVNAIQNGVVWRHKAESLDRILFPAEVPSTTSRKLCLRGSGPTSLSACSNCQQ